MADQLKIMAISAHPADFCSRSGGTLIKHVQAGTRVKVVWLTHGETEESGALLQDQPDISVEEVRRIREEEAFACAEVIGAEGKMFGFGDNPLRMTPERMELLAQEIADFGPDILLTHWKDELTYPTHMMTSRAAVEAAMMVKATRDIRFFEPNIGHAGRLGFMPDHYIDISEVFEKKVEALTKLAAQPDLVPNYTKCNLWRGMEMRVDYAEGFVRLAPVLPLQDLLTG